MCVSAHCGLPDPTIQDLHHAVYEWAMHDIVKVERSAVKDQEYCVDLFLTTDRRFSLAFESDRLAYEWKEDIIAVCLPLSLGVRPIVAHAFAGLGARRRQTQCARRI